MTFLVLLHTQGLLPRALAVCISPYLDRLKELEDAHKRLGEQEGLEGVVIQLTDQSKRPRNRLNPLPKQGSTKNRLFTFITLNFG